MTYIFIGTIVNTHGIKGEVRILSDFEYKDKVFKKGTKIYIGQNKEQETIAIYRHHKTFEMITFDGISDINDVLGYKTEKVYINKEDIKIDGYFDEDYIGLTAYAEKPIGEIINIINNKSQKLLIIKGQNKTHYIPMVDEFIKKVDFDKKIVHMDLIEGLIDEDWYFDPVSGNVYRIFKWVNN